MKAETNKIASLGIALALWVLPTTQQLLLAFVNKEGMTSSIVQMYQCPELYYSVLYRVVVVAKRKITYCCSVNKRMIPIALRITKLAIM